MTQPFQNPRCARALAQDMETGEDTARFQFRWVCAASDAPHRTETGADKLAAHAQADGQKEAQA